jgi:hypothetical protein
MTTLPDLSIIWDIQGVLQGLKWVTEEMNKGVCFQTWPVG